MIMALKPIDEKNKDAVLGLFVRDDQPYVATNSVSLKQAEEQNSEYSEPHVRLRYMPMKGLSVSACFRSILRMRMMISTGFGVL